jgi:hypothetical protein
VTKHLELEHDDDAGYWLLREDGVGLAKSKSRTVMMRVRAALSAPNALVGLTVELGDGRVQGHGLVLGLAPSAQLVVRLADDRLATWSISDCKIVDAPKPDKDTPSDDPPNIYISGAVQLLEQVLKADSVDEFNALISDIKKFLAARAAAEAVL